MKPGSSPPLSPPQIVALIAGAIVVIFVVSTVWTRAEQGRCRPRSYSMRRAIDCSGRPSLANRRAMGFRN